MLNADQHPQKLLLTGATGFVGSRLLPMLAAQGHEIRCLTRDAAAARQRFPRHVWVEGSISDASTIGPALEQCSAAYYLVHEMGTPGDFAAREIKAATTFAEAAGRAGVKRIIYLGGVMPLDGGPSEHLRSRARVGEILREGPVPAVELRASMIAGNGSLSFLIVRDLAARLPFMILPRWLDSRTEPVAIDDVLLALVRALDIPLQQSQSFDLPGPEILSGREILMQTAAVFGLRPPLAVRVPVLTPRLSSHWVRFITRADWEVAREIVVGLTTDLLARDRSYWDLIGKRDLLTFREAATRAIAAEKSQSHAETGWSRIEQLVKRYRGRKPE